jgi:hypothetical protein
MREDDPRLSVDALTESSESFLAAAELGVDTAGLA